MDRTRLCPSGQPGAQRLLLGVVEHTDDGARVSYLREEVLVSQSLLDLTGPVAPTRVFRIASKCEERRCTHFDGASCKLVTRIVENLPAVVNELPPCRIRSNCRWYKQEGRPACLRCPQIVTESMDGFDQYKYGFGDSLTA